MDDFPFETKNEPLRQLRTLLDSPEGQAFQRALRAEKQAISVDSVILDMERRLAEHPIGE